MLKRLVKAGAPYYIKEAVKYPDELRRDFKNDGLPAKTIERYIKILRNKAKNNPKYKRSF
ncbi:MAG: hypothetical protein ABIE74_01595 [Pseudomonadota bacterium]